MGARGMQVQGFLARAARTPGKAAASTARRRVTPANNPLPRAESTNPRQVVQVTKWTSFVVYLSEEGRTRTM